MNRWFETQNDSLSTLLPRLERAWRLRKAPIVEGLRPGLTDDAIDALMAPTGLVPPGELRTWWRWHDGSAGGESIGPGSWQFGSLAEMIQTLEYWRRFQASSCDASEPAVWKSSWFPAVQRGPNHVLHVDTSAATTAGEAPVGNAEPFDDEPRDVVRATSFTQVVGLWLGLIESGTFTLVDGYWDADWNSLPTELKTGRLI
ncbi:hypothetical protein [Cellulomonas sp. T2.31MG-18]|uniref:hypothetical protein n=1 Tax=Cellulomonas sp. T2.31MG-18 TaxID=3157619 RepID=UPI00366AC670